MSIQSWKIQKKKRKRNEGEEISYEAQLKQ